MKSVFPRLSDGGQPLLSPDDVLLLMSSEVLKQLRDDVANDPSHLSKASAMEPVVNFCMASMESLGLKDAMRDVPSKDVGARLYFMCLGLLQGLQIGVVAGAANESGMIWTQDDGIDLASMRSASDMTM